MNGKELVYDVLPSEVLTDATNIRGGYPEIDSLGVNIAVQGLVNPPTVAWSTAKEKYIVIDGHRRILSLRKLEQGELENEMGEPYALPDNYRLQVFTKNFEDLSFRILRAYRVGANFHTRKPNDVELGTVIKECLDNYCEQYYSGITYDEASRKYQRDAFDAVVDLFKPITSNRLRRALNVIKNCGTIEVRALVKPMLESGRINAEVMRPLENSKIQ